MTDKEIKTLLWEWDRRCGGTNTVSDLILLRDCLCAALEAEKVGEVVLWSGVAKSGEAEFMMRKSHGDNTSVCLFPIEYAKVKGKTGTIIFREDK